MGQFGELVKAGRIAKSLTLEAAATKCGISESYHRAIENGSKLPRLDVCFQLAIALELDPARILWQAINESVPPEAQKFLTDSVDNFLKDLTAEARTLLKKLERLPEDKRTSAYRILEEVIKLHS